MTPEERFAWETAIKIVEEEPELPGPMPQENIEAAERVGIEAALRATVAATKGCILKRLRASLAIRKSITR